MLSGLIWMFATQRRRALELASHLSEEITERKRAYQSLRASEKKFRAYFDHSMFGMAVTSLEKGWVNVNDALCASLGYSRDELMRLNWAELTYPEDLALDNEQFNRVLKGEIDNYTLNKRFTHKDGHLVYTRLAVGCVRKIDGTVDYLVALVEDISERIEAQDEILRLNTSLLALTKNTAIDAGARASAFQEICKATSQALDAARVSIWYFDADREAIVCEELYEQGDRKSVV